MDNKSISRLESLVQEMIEGSFGRLFGGQLAPLDVAGRLVRAMEDSTGMGDMAPAFEVALNPQDLAGFSLKGRDLEQALGQAAWRLGRQSGLPLVARPVITVVPDELVRRHTVQITPRSPQQAQEGIQATQVVQQGHLAAGAALAAIEAQEAFLIVQGRRLVPLDKPVTTIGRRTDNDIVLDLPSISRQHAQIRWRFGRFILYDVGNRGRTSVNGIPVTEHVLQPGDAIALSEAVLIYAEQDSYDPAGDLLDDEGTKTRLRPPGHHE